MKFFPKNILFLPPLRVIISELIKSYFIRISAFKLTKMQYCFLQKIFCFVCLVLRHFTCCRKSRKIAFWPQKHLFFSYMKCFITKQTKQSIFWRKQQCILVNLEVLILIKQHSIHSGQLTPSCDESKIIIQNFKKILFPS